ncbi:MAG: ATP-binding protein [Vicinamibacterales bacterium]
MRLVLTGAHVADAEVRFNRGLNLISGPSDTGKTFILQCIDFMLGGRDTPRTSLRCTGDTAILEIVALADDMPVRAVARSPRWGVRLRRPDGSEAVLAERHAADRDDTVSQFLLDLVGLAGKRVRTNARGQTRPLSFRDLAHLIIISEEEIIRAQSPVLSGRCDANR